MKSVTEERSEKGMFEVILKIRGDPVRKPGITKKCAALWQNMEKGKPLGQFRSFFFEHSKFGLHTSPGLHLFSATEKLQLISSTGSYT